MEERSVEERLVALEADPKEPENFKGDKVGAGRYIICFLLAGFVGLWIAYWARYYGWRCVWIFLILYGLLFASSFCYGFIEGITADCYTDAYGREVCTYD